MADSALQVLLIEDNPRDVHLLRELLHDTSAPLTIAHAEQLATALLTLARGRPDVILLDLSLPDSQGLATFHSVHTCAPNIPLVILTGLDDEDIALQAMQAGAQDYLVKGQADGPGLLRALRYAIERQRLRQQLERATEELGNERALLAQRVEERTTDLILANAELARAARLKDEFLASMSHELCTPLNAVLGLTEALREQIYGPLNERQLRALAVIDESGTHLLALINDVLDVAKIGADKLSIELSPLIVEDLCETSMRLVAQAAQKKQLSTLVSVEPTGLTMQADVRRLKQILVNLLANAVKFTPAGGAIGLEVTSDSAWDTVTFTVWDTGIGIAADELPRLFQPFTQLDTGLSRLYEGTGLGLTLVQRLTRLHGGHVAVASTPGAGSRFSVKLPRRLEEQD